MSQVSEASVKSSFALYGAVAQEQSGNLVMAPLPFSIAFALLLNGSDAATQQEIRQLMQLGDLGLSEINAQSQALQKALENLNAGSGNAFVLANSLWASLPLAFSPGFLDAGRRYYATQIAAVPRAELPDRVSRWSRETTHGLVDMKLDKSDFALLSATYFKGKWKYPFDDAATKPEDFHPEDAKAHKVPMMSRRGEYPYYEGRNFHAVALEFAFATMHFLLPKSGLLSHPSLKEIEQQVLGDGWIMTQPFARRPGLVKIPKFKLRYDGEFIPVLRKLGLNRLFDSFDSLRPAVTHPEGAKVTQVLQNSTITVDEKGAEAASVLAVVMAVGAAAGWKPPKPFEFIADRPFSFWITDKATGVVLFIGRVADPE